MDRRAFLKGLVATAAGILVPASVAAEPERRVWALDRTMVQSRFQPPLGSQYWDTEADAMMTYTETGWVEQQLFFGAQVFVGNEPMWVSTNGVYRDAKGIYYTEPSRDNPWVAELINKAWDHMEWQSFPDFNPRA